MYHHIVLAFIKQNHKYTKKRNERLETCLLLWALEDSILFYCIYSYRGQHTDMISLYHVLSITKGRLYLFYSRWLRRGAQPECHPI